MFNTCAYKVRYGDRLREAEQLQRLGEFKNFPRERPEKLRWGWLRMVVEWMRGKSI
jgi:hypothetical protein